MKTFKLSIFLLIFAATALAQEASPLTPFQEFAQKLSSDGGVWLAENPEFTPGSGQPSHYGYEFGLPLGKAILSLTIYGVGEDGERSDYWYSITWWDVATETIRLHNWGVNGVANVTGTITLTDTGDETELEGVDWGGDPRRFKDTTNWSGNDSFESQSTNFKDGQWVEGQRLNWQRASQSEQ